MKDTTIKIAALPAGDIQVRGHKDGTWTVWYLDEGYIPCSPVCRLKEIDKKHTCDYNNRKFIQSHFGEKMIGHGQPDRSFEGAMEYAEYLRAGNEDREIKVVESR